MNVVSGKVLYYNDAMATPVFWTSFFQQKKSLEKLIEESRADQNFYLLLSVSSFITTLGLVADSAIVVIGGMLVAPLLFPILSFAMGITTANLDSITRSANILIRSIFIVFIISMLSSLLFRNDNIAGQGSMIENIIPNLLYFLVAFAAGIAAAYTWVRPNLSAALPGVAVAVALIPPLTAVGVGMTHGLGYLIIDSISLFFLNFLGIAIGALIIFSLFGFSHFRKEEEELIEKEKEEKLFSVRQKLSETKEKLEGVENKIEEKVRGDTKDTHT